MSKAITGIVISHATVIKEWLDYNNHMNVAYYIAVFDKGIDAFKDSVGVSMDYIANEKRSTVALESHITYQREASLADRLRVETRVVDFDGKRTHLYQEMYRDDELLATQETLSISFNTELRKTCDFEPWIAENYRAMVAAQAQQGTPDWIGRSIGIRKGKPK
ncbi:MAG: thioesterase family protein [Pseudomonadota bacterium]